MSGKAEDDKPRAMNSPNSPRVARKGTWPQDLPVDPCADTDAGARLGRAASRRDQLATEFSNPFDPIQDAEMEKVICDCLALLLPSLPSEQEKILRGVDLDGAAPEEIAAGLGLSPGQASAELRRGRQNVTERIGAMLSLSSDHGQTPCACPPDGSPET